MFSSRLGKLLGFLPFTAIGCGTSIFTTPVTFNPAAPSRGAVYYLPKSLLVVSLKVAVTAETKPTCGNGINVADCNLEVNAFEIREPSVETLAVPDPSQAFAIETTDSFVVKTEFKAELNEHGELTSSTSTSANQALTFATTGLEAAAKLMGVVAPAGPAASRREELAKQAVLLKKAISDIDARIETNGPIMNPTPVPAKPGATPLTVPAKPAPTDPAKVKLAVEEVTSLLELRKKLVEQLGAVQKDLAQAEIVLPVTCIVDPTPGKVDVTATCAGYQGVRKTLTAANIAVTVPLPTLTLTLSHQGGPTQPAGARPADRVSGFYYRIPAWYEAELVSSTGARVRSSVAIPQRGQIALWALGEHDLRSGKTIAVELHPGLGSVKSVTLNAEPVSTDDLKKVVDAAKGLATSKDDAEVDTLKRQAAKVEAELALQKAKNDLAEAKNPKKKDEPQKEE